MILKKIVPLLFPVAILILLAQCTGTEKDYRHFSDDRSSEYELELRKVRGFQIREHSKIDLGRIGDFIVFNEDESLMAWINESDNEIFVTDTLGNISLVIGGTGRGPEEFINISSLGFNDKNQVVVYDWEQDLIKFFNLDGRLEYTAEGLIKDELWIRSDRILFNEGRYYFGIQKANVTRNKSSYWESKLIAEYTGSGKLNHLFGGFTGEHETRDLYYNSGMIAQHQNKRHLLITHRTYHRIQVFDLESRARVATFGVKPPGFKYSDDQVTPGDPRPVRNEKNLHQTFVDNSFVSDELFYFHFFNFTNDYWELRDPNLMENYFAVYKNDKPYTFYGELKLPYTPLGVSAGGSIYMLENNDADGLDIGVYKVLLNRLDK